MKLNTGFDIVYNHFGFSPGGITKIENDKVILIIDSKNVLGHEDKAQKLVDSGAIIVYDKDKSENVRQILIYDEVRII